MRELVFGPREGCFSLALPDSGLPTSHKLPLSRTPSLYSAEFLGEGPIDIPMSFFKKISASLPLSMENQRHFRLLSPFFLPNLLHHDPRALIPVQLVKWSYCSFRCSVQKSHEPEPAPDKIARDSNIARSIFAHSF